MKDVEGIHFSDLAGDFDLIIGSDLIYFEDSIEPLIKMIRHLNSKSKKPQTFYICMKVRGHELKEKLLEQLNANFKVTTVDQEYIDAQASIHNAVAFVFKMD